MANEDVQVKAKAGQLLKAGHKELEGYRQMSTADLKKLIVKIDKAKKTPAATPVNGDTPAKAKGSAAPAKGGKVSSTPAKGKGSTSTTSPAKGGKAAPAAQSNGQKSAPVKGAAGSGKASRQPSASTKGATPTKPVAGKCKTPGHNRRKAAQTAGIYANLCAECTETAKAERAAAKTPAKVDRGAKGNAAAGKGAKPATGKGAKATPASGKGATASKADLSKCKVHPRRQSIATRGRYAGLCQECKDNAQAELAKDRPSPSRRGKYSADNPGIARIGDLRQIDWKVETRIGEQGGKRKTVLDSLRKHKNYDKVNEELAPLAVKWYPDAIDKYPTSPTKKAASLRMLRWLVARVALDYVKATNQHEGVVRSGTGSKPAAGKGAAPKAAPTVAKGKCRNHPRRKALATAGRYANLCQECKTEAQGAAKAAPASGKGAKPTSGKGAVASGKGAKPAPAKGKGARG